MKKLIYALLCVTLLGSATSAQELYIGLGAAPPTNTDDETIGLSAQAGVGLLGGFSVRAAVETSADFSTFRLASGDVLFNVGLPLTDSKAYFGAGADAFFEEQPDEIADVQNGPFGAHVVGGGELRLGRFGVFGEVQPGVLFDGFDGYIRARAGVNLHF